MILGTVIRRLTAVLLAMACAGTALHAQSGTTTANATMVTPVTVTGLAALDFGNVLRGVTRSVAWNDATSGRFRVNGLGTSQLAITFTLPSTLSNGFSTMPIDTYRIRVNGTNTTPTANNIGVTSGVPFTRSLEAGQLWFWLGARVQPSATQAPGVYASPVVLTAAYTGV